MEVVRRRTADGEATGAEWLPRQGELAALVRKKDWSNNAIGPLETWPQNLKTVLQIMLSSRYAMWMGWGPELSFFYNDAYARDTLGMKHPWALGRPAHEVWAEIWPDIGPRIETVLQTGEATWDEALLLFLERSGYPEETYHTFSYSPLADDDGTTVGMLCVVTEETERVIGERRLSLLREVASALAAASTEEDVFAGAARAIAVDQRDLPFTVLYCFDADGKTARLVSAIGIPAGHPAAPRVIDLNHPDTPWPAREVLRGEAPVSLEDLAARFPEVPTGPWEKAPEQATVVPLAQQGQERPAGFLAAAINPYRKFDDDYRGFLGLLTAQIAAGLANARAYEAERKRAEALAEIDRAKTTFFSNVSHEFRTPLTLMLGPVEDLLGRLDEGVPGESRELLTVVHRNALRLQKLVNSLLDFSRIEAGRVQASYVPTDLCHLTAELASVFRSAIEKAGLRLVIECEEPLSEPVYVDREMWEKIVLNLLSNAFKFTLEGAIRVNVRERKGIAELVVQDTGVGIPEPEIPRLFERFHRVENTRGRTHEGTGIGLALVQELVKLHGGTILAESAPGEGTTFTVSLPLGSAHLPEDRITACSSLSSTAVGAHAYIEEALRWLPEGEGLPEIVEGAGILARADRGEEQGRARIVLADDNADMREYVRRLLAAYYEVEAVGDGLAAVAAIRREKPDLVLSDIMMPGLDGFGLLRALREDPESAAVPIIFLSARAGEEARIEGLERGADDYLTKPFSAKELLARVSAHLELARVRFEASAALRESEERFRNMADHAPVMMWVTDPTACCTYLNERWYEFTGQSPETGLGFGWLDATHPDDREQAAAVFLAANQKHEAFRLEYRLRRKDGEYRWAMDAAAPRFGRGGEFLGYIGSVIDISERKEIEDALRDANRRKDEFLAMLAHELRNPLSPVVTAARLLTRQYRDNASLVRQCEVIDRQVRNMSRLLDDLLDVSRITRGRVGLKKEPLSLQTVITHAVEASRPFLEERGHELVLALSPEPLALEADRLRLEQSVVNLLNNAAKYTDPGGTITVTSFQDGAEAVLQVQDTGIGIGPDLLPFVFDLFTQEKRGLDRSQGGLGIGLTLVKNLVELHGGTITAHSEGLGRGSEFTVRLPLSGASLEPPEGDRSKPDEKPTTPKGRKRVLVVDDNPDAADTLTELLAFWEYDAKAAHDGLSAIGIAREYRPDAILMDIGMPGMDGYEAARRIRRESELRGIRMVALTGYGREEDRERASSAGFDAHLTKPVDPDEMENLLAGFFSADEPSREVAKPPPPREGRQSRG